jgi:sugar phosphate isomerase/epimerase
MIPNLVIPSTTSHKHEPLLTTLEVFARLGMRDLDLNLNHIIERGAVPEVVREALASNGQRAWIVSGGWCDFYHVEPRIQETLASVEHQVALARFFGVDRLRLFFGRLPVDAYSSRSLDAVAANIRRFADQHPDMVFLFENHDGASSQPEVCRAILDAVDRRNVKLNFDPINFEAAGVDSRAAVDVIGPLVGHVHLKGLDEQGYCAFGQGHVDLIPVLRALLERGYCGGFSVEYEGPSDRTVQLYQSLRVAEAAIARLVRACGGGASINQSAPGRDSVDVLHSRTPQPGGAEVRSGQKR